MADSDWDVDDCKNFLAERRFDLGKEDGVGDMIKDDCDKHDVITVMMTVMIIRL